jgi:hypothetical protein
MDIIKDSAAADPLGSNNSWIDREGISSVRSHRSGIVVR